MPGFHIRECEVLNLGSIDHVLLNLSSSKASLSVLLAANGVGKTTALEALSLVGHLPCFPIQYADKKSPSLLRLASNGTTHTAERLQDLLTEIPLAGITAGNWLKHFRSKDRLDIGAVRFVVWDRDNPATSTSDNSDTQTYACEFIVLVQSRDIDQTPTLTRLLSREHDEQLVPDVNLDTSFLILVETKEAHSQSFIQLLQRIARGRTYYLDTNEHRALSDMPNFAALDMPADGPSRHVSYVNTDLNDFGRGNDLRESPKNIATSFSPEFARRLRLPFDETSNGKYRYLGDLNRRLVDILGGLHGSHSDPFAVTSPLQLKVFRLSSPGVIEVLANRGFGRDFSVEFFSAGENEVFFLLLMCQSFGSSDDSGGILLLDEPDLHIANPMKLSFFRALIETCGKETQLVMCTHSAVAVSAVNKLKGSLSSYVRVMYRRFTDIDARNTELVVDFDSRFVSRIRNLGARQWLTFNLLSTFRLWLRAFWSPPLRRNASRVWLEQLMVLTSSSLLAGLLLILATAFLNDNFNVKSESPVKVFGMQFGTVGPDNIVAKLFFNKEALEVHEFVRSATTSSVVVLLGLAIVWLFIRLAERGIRSELIKRSKRHAGIDQS